MYVISIDTALYRFRGAITLVWGALGDVRLILNTRDGGPEEIQMLSRAVHINKSDGILYETMPHSLSVSLLLSRAQIRRHGSQDDCRQSGGRRLLAERSARHRAARARHRVQLQPHLPPEPAGGQAESSKGKPIFSSRSSSNPIYIDPRNVTRI